MFILNNKEIYKNWTPKLKKASSYSTTSNAYGVYKLV